MQGGGFYNPNMATPDWGQGITQFLNQMMAIKEQKKQEGIAQQQAQLKQEQWEKGYQLDQQRAAALNRLTEAQIEQIANKPVTTQTEWQYKQNLYTKLFEANKITEEQYISLRTTDKMPTPPVAPKPPTVTDFDKRLKWAQRAFKEGRITQAQLDEIGTGLDTTELGGKTPVALPPGQKLTNRRLITSGVKKTFAEIQANSPKDFTDPEKITMWKNRHGIHLDMPSKYSALKRIASMSPDLLNPADTQYIKRAEATVQFLNDNPEIEDLRSLLKQYPGLKGVIMEDVAMMILAARKKENKTIVKLFGINLIK
jgi:hypothetical protein